MSSAVLSNASVNSIANLKCSSFIVSSKSRVAIIPNNFSIFFGEPKSSAIGELERSLSSSFSASYSKSLSLMSCG